MQHFTEYQNRDKTKFRCSGLVRVWLKVDAQLVENEGKFDGRFPQGFIAARSAPMSGGHIGLEEQQVVVGISPGGMSTLLVPEKPLVATPVGADAGTGFSERLRSAIAGQVGGRKGNRS